MASQLGNSINGIDLGNDENCVFVANLPQRMTNEQLAYALMMTFRPFGTVVSVKASRDTRGRPFGFVEFSNQSSANTALQASPQLYINYRNLRLEPARCQKRLSIRIALNPNEQNLSDVMKSIRSEMLENLDEHQFKMTFSNEDDIFYLTILAKFDATAPGEAACQKWKTLHPDWLFDWTKQEKGGPISSVRSSGLVQIIPSKLPGMLAPPFPQFQPYTTYPMGFMVPYSYDPGPVIERRIPLGSHPAFEEELVGSASTLSLASDFEELSLADGSSTQPVNLPEKVLQSTIFAGRLNSQKITRDLIVEHFKTYGPIRYVCLFNRLAISPEGIPLDAYAFITFAEPNAAKEAITGENGNVWLGQTVKCEAARVMPPTAMVVQLYHRDTLPISQNLN